ncbi:MAG: hypothetical protein AAF208_11845 [Cyanobacteria bacterium P01_A01_bin.45]
MNFNKRLALVFVATSAGILGISSSALAFPRPPMRPQTTTQVNPSGNAVSGQQGGSAAAVIQMVEIYGLGKTTNINAAAGSSSATATGATQVNLKDKAASLTGTAAASDRAKVKVVTDQGGKGSDLMNDTKVELGL